MKSFCDEKKNKVSITELLDECTKVYAELPDEYESEENEYEKEEKEDEENDDIYMDDFIEAELTPMSGVVDNTYDPFENALMNSTELEKIQEQQRIQYEYQQKQLSKNEKKFQISDIIQNMKTSEIKQHVGEAEKKIECVFYLDGFTIDKGPFLSYEDPTNKKIVESLKNGVVPREYSEHYSEVDVHVIWENYTYAEKQELDKKVDEDELEDLYFQQQLEQIAEMERANRETQIYSGSNQDLIESVDSAPFASSTQSSNIETTIKKTLSPTSTNENKTIDIQDKKESISSSRDSTIFSRKEGVFNYDLKESETTNVQFRADTQRIASQFNLDDPVHVLIDFIAYHPNNPYEKFRLVQIFPRKNLEYSNQTLRESGLKNTTLIVQRVD